MSDPEVTKKTRHIRPCCTTGIVVCVLVIGGLYWAHLHARASGRQVSCLSTIKQVNLAMNQYAYDHDDHFPPASAWNEAILKTYMRRSQFEGCPGTPGEDPDFAMNAGLSSNSAKNVERQYETVLIYESISGKNRAGGPELLPKPGRHMRGNNIGFADGHAKWYKDGTYSQLRWKP